MGNKNSKIKTGFISAKKTYDILDYELKYRIREFSFYLYGDRVDDFVAGIKEIGEVQDALDNKSIRIVNVKMNEDNFYVFTFELLEGEIEYETINKVEVVCYSLEDFPCKDIEYFIIMNI